MRHLLFLIGAATSLLALTVSAHAATVSFVFDGALPGPMAVDAPVNATTPCGSPTFDFCDVGGTGLDYDKGGISFTAFGLADGLPSVLIQDIQGLNQGLGVLSEGRFRLDQINFDANESVFFSFDREVSLGNLELNNGTGDDCPVIGAEGGCGVFDLVIDRGLATEQTLLGLTALALQPGNWLGTTFEFVAQTAGAGFSIAAFDITAPLPAALPLFVFGLGALGVARRRKL